MCGHSFEAASNCMSNKEARPLLECYQVTIIVMRFPLLAIEFNVIF